MKTSMTAICWIAVGMWMVQVPVQAAGAGGAGAGGGGGGFGNGGFHGGSVGNAGNVNNRPYYNAGYYGYSYAMGPTEFAGDQALGSGDIGASSGPPVAGTGTGGGPPQELQDGTGIYVQHGEKATGGPSFYSDWWAQDPRSEAAQEAVAPANTGIGTAVATLPRGGETVFTADTSYYVYDGTYYQPTDSGYQIIAPPVGLEVRRLPDAAEMEKVDGKQLFIYKDIYYEALYSGSGIVYKVVGEPSS